MRISWKQLKVYRVETVSGRPLGRVRDIVFDTEGQLIAQYIVSKSFFAAQIYQIGRDQVVRFEDKKIIVDDAVVREGISMREKRSLPSVEPALMREE
jgi:sporulation protein YlmC with PRC-barrel domain